LRESQWQPVIRESESPGETSSSARERGWLPGRCGLLPFLLTEQKRPLATAAVADLEDRDESRETRLGKRLCQMRHLFGGAVGVKQSLRRVRGDKSKDRNPRTMRLKGGWPLSRILFSRES